MVLRRRELLAGAAVALAGCAEVQEFAEEAAPPRGHPLAGETVVAVADKSTSSHDLEALADEALDFWNDNAAQYAGFEVSFRRAGAGEPPDVVVEFLNSREELDGCSEYSSEQVLGCAPLIREGNRIDRPVTAEVVATGRPYGDVLITAQHELGHVLGLGHEDEPAYVMSNRIRDRLPKYESRIEVLETFRTGWKTRNEGTRTYNEGIQLWNDESYEAAVGPFGRAADSYRAIGGHVDDAEAAATAFEGMNRPDTVDRQRLREQFDTTRTVAGLLVEVAEHMRAAAEAMADGDRSAARDRNQSADETLNEVEGIDAPTPNDVARALGLVRNEEMDDAEEPGSG